MIRRVLALALLLPLGTVARADTVVIDVIALSGDAAVGGPAGALYDSLGVAGIPVPQQNANGQLAFYAQLAIGPGGVTAADDFALYAPSAGGLAPVLRAGLTPPGGPPGTQLSGTDIPATTLGANGDVLVSWALATGVGGVTSLTDDAVWLTDGQGGVELVARAGDAAPGTADVFEAFSFFGGRLDASGRVVLRGVTDRAFGANTGIWATDASGDLQKLFLEGDPAPEPAGATLGGFPIDPISLGDNGHITVNGTLAIGGGVTPDDDHVIWISDGSSPFSLLARENDPVPGAPGRHYLNFGTPSVNEHGDVAFMAHLKSGGGAIMVPDGGGGHVAAIFAGGPVPGLPGTEISSPGFSPVINRHGEVAFGSSLALGVGGVTTENNGVTFGPGVDGQTELRLREGDPLPGPGSFVVDGLLTGATMNDRAETALIANVEAGAGGVQRALLLTRRGGRVTSIVREGDAIEVAPGDVRTVSDFGACCNPQDGTGRFLFHVRFGDGSSALLSAGLANEVPALSGAWAAVAATVLVAAGSAMLRRPRPHAPRRAGGGSPPLA